MKSGMLFSCLRRARLLGSLAIRWKEPTHMSTISSMYTPSYIIETTGKKLLHHSRIHQLCKYRPFTISMAHSIMCSVLSTLYHIHKNVHRWALSCVTYNESSWGTRHSPSTRLLVSAIEKLPDLGNNSTGTKNSMVLIAKSKVTNQT